MADVALENAKARREHIGQQIEMLTAEINDKIERHAKLRAELASVDAFIRQWHEMAGIRLPEDREQRKPEAPAEGGKRIRPKNPPKELVAEACVNYLREAGHPLMRAELLDRLTEDGIIIRGKDPAMVLSTMLWRSKDTITRLRGGGYWPRADMPPPGEQTTIEGLMA